MRNAPRLAALLALAWLTVAPLGLAAAQGPPMPGQMGPPPGAAGAGAKSSGGAAWLQGEGGGLPWQIGAMFTGFWVLVAIEIVIISKPSQRPDKPKKIVDEAA